MAPVHRLKLDIKNYFSPCSNKNAGPEAKEHFQKILQAYETLRDPAKRSQYDALKNTDFEMGGSGGGYAAHGPWSARPGHNPTMDEWERQFDEWLKKNQNQYGEDSEETERIRRERASAERIAKAEAWEREKWEASAVKARSLRIKKKAEQAKYVRQAAVLRRFWQGRPSVTWQDATVGAAFCLLTAGLAVYWRDNILEKAMKSSVVENNEQQQEEPRMVAA